MGDFDTTLNLADELWDAVSGGAAFPGDPAYATACRLFNGAVRSRPVAVAFCARPEDVTGALCVARRHGLPVSVRGGGHDLSGRALADGGLVLDMTRMRQVTVDAQARIAIVQGGATIRDVVNAAAPHGLVPVAGNSGTVGVAGLTTGGGYGLLNGRHGLAADNLLGAELILATGRAVMTDAGIEPDLFWALRGGGGNFGVITSLRIRLHPASDLLAGWVLVPGDTAGDVLRRYAAFAAFAPDALGVLTALMTGPDGRPAVAFAPFWTGNRTEGERVLGALQDLGTPQVATVGPTTYGDMLAQFDAAWRAGRHYAVRTRWLPALTDDAIAVMVAAAARKTSPHTGVAIHHMHGAPTRVATDATAFGVRGEHYMVEIIAAWEPDQNHRASEGARHHRWADELWRELAPFAMPGGYANLLSPGDHEQAADAYGGNAERLAALKRRYDPDGVFAHTIPLPAQSSRSATL
jgi:FAD/FMN-containing dehydrogenase